MWSYRETSGPILPVVNIELSTIDRCGCVAMEGSFIGLILIKGSSVHVCNFLKNSTLGVSYDSSYLFSADLRHP